MQRSAKVALVAVILVVVGGGAAAWWYLSGDTADRAALPERSADGAPVITAGGLGDTDPDTPSLTGRWVIRQGPEVFVGYRIDELAAGETLQRTATGRTGDVQGSMVFEGAVVTEAEVTANLQGLTSDQGLRDEYLRTEALQTEQFPEATFVMTSPIDMVVLPDSGSDVAVSVTGDLTLHGVTQPVTLDLTARWNGDTLDVAGAAPILLSDFGIAVPDTPVATVQDRGELEVQLTFVPEEAAA